MPLSLTCLYFCLKLSNTSQTCCFKPDMPAPVQDAAKQLNVGMTTLKKICRDVGLTRWPFRKRFSIERLIERTKYFIEEDDEQLGKGQRSAALQTLEERKEGLKVKAAPAC